MMSTSSFFRITDSVGKVVYSRTNFSLPVLGASSTWTLGWVGSQIVAKGKCSYFLDSYLCSCCPLSLEFLGLSQIDPVHPQWSHSNHQFLQKHFTWSSLLTACFPRICYSSLVVLTLLQQEGRNCLNHLSFMPQTMPSLFMGLLFLLCYCWKSSHVLCLWC